MTERVMTNDEISELQSPTYTMLGFARAVEQAVLEKVRCRYAEYAGVMGFVLTEREARERERRAAAWGNRIYSSFASFEDQLDAAYPSLKPVEPPPLVLSTGRYRKPRGNVLWQHDLTPVSYNTCATPHCETPADARALADWLEKYGT